MKGAVSTPQCRQLCHVRNHRAFKDVGGLHHMPVLIGVFVWSQSIHWQRIHVATIFLPPRA